MLQRLVAFALSQRLFVSLAGLGFSPMAQRYAISGRDEAVAYLAHPILGPRLRELTAIDALNRELTERAMADARKTRDNNDDSAPQDVEALRQSIARKLEAIIAERKDPVSGEPDPC